MALKRAGHSTIPQLAAALSVTNEAVWQQLTVSHRQGWVSADDLFPKDYAGLALTLFDELPDAERTLTDITDRRVDALRGARDSEAIRAIDRRDDPYTDIETSERGYRLVERDCPYLRFAMERPLFCSTTVTTLRRLTNAEVVREERFQDGDRRCVFHVYSDAPLKGARRDDPFEREPPKETKPPRGRGR